jgi:peptidoglycan/LPS O-acetylase OafA/YrhL
MTAAFAGASADKDRAAHYRPDIDGLRAVAVAVVVAYHAFPLLLPGGFVGVDIFFVISGYLISGIILGALAEGRFSFAHFYARRIRRIFPALAVVLAAVLIGGWFVLYADDYQRLGRHVAAGAAFASNFVLWRESSYFDTAVELKPLLHLWSLGIEEQFYLAWPVMLVAASRWRLGPRGIGGVGRGPLALTLAIGTASFLIAIWTVRIDRTPAFYAPWNRFWELLAGATLACIEADAALATFLARVTARPFVPNVLAIAGALMIVAGVILIDSTRVFPGLWVLLPVAGTFFLLVAGDRAWVNRRILALRPVVWVGLISYPLYLWHWPLLSFTRLMMSGTPPALIRLGLVAASVVLAWLTYRAIEWPVRFGSRRRTVVPILATSMVGLFAFGLATTVSGGFIDRRINRDDAARIIDYYQRMRRGELHEAYRDECDFMEWKTERVRTELDPSCTAAGRERTFLLWGDSFAQALSLGIREQLPPGSSLAQITTSACGVAVDNFDMSVRDARCEKANVYAMDAIRRLRPAVVILAQSGGHTVTDWPKIAARALQLGAGHVLVVGPFPLWWPGLPAIVGEHHLRDRAEYVRIGLDQSLFANDRQLAAKLSGLPNVAYVSLLDQLCRDGACLARVPGESDLDLMVLDFGHLTPKGSSYVGRTVFKPYLDRATPR